MKTHSTRLGNCLAAAPAFAVIGLFFAFAATAAELSTMEKITAQLDGCSQRWQYDYDDWVELGAHELGPRELEWRRCVYGAIERHIVPKSSVADSYRDLIAQDKKLTVSVTAGEITRKQRRATLTRLLDLLQQQERQAAKRAEADTQKYLEGELARMKDMQRFQQRMRRTMTPRF